MYQLLLRMEYLAVSSMCIFQMFYNEKPTDITIKIAMLSLYCVFCPFILTGCVKNT